MDLLFWLELAVVLVCIGIGGRYSGIGLGAAGGVGVTILVLVFGMKPAQPPTTVVFIIIAVITAASVLQGAGGLDLMVRLAEKILRKKPQAITFVAPVICSIFTIFCGTTYVAFSVYPVIAEVAAEAKIRPERPISVTVIAAGISIVASPMSAATAGMVATLATFGVSLGKILAISMPAFFIGMFFACLSVFKRGKELEDDPEFQRRITAGEYEFLYNEKQKEDYKAPRSAKLALIVFGLGVLVVLFFGTFTELLPKWDGSRLSTPMLIQMIMLAATCIMIMVSKTPTSKFASGSVFRSGLIGVVAVFGISWMTGTFFEAYKPQFVEIFSNMVSTMPMLFGLVLFLFSMVVFSPAATVAALMPLGVGLGIPPALLIALYPATCGDFIVPGANQIGCCSFDRTGTTKIGKFVINHSYIRPGFVMLITQIMAGYLISKIIF